MPDRDKARLGRAIGEAGRHAFTAIASATIAGLWSDAGPVASVCLGATCIALAMFAGKILDD